MKRRGLRLEWHDYATAGVYFVTICVQDRRALFGQIDGEVMALSPAGQMVLDVWRALPVSFEGVGVDNCALVMPDHLHGIIVLERDGQWRLPDVVGAFKSMTTLRYGDGVRHHGWPPFERRLWQRGYHEHIVRNEESLREIREYILTNPIRWALRHGTWADDPR